MTTYKPEDYQAALAAFDGAITSVLDCNPPHYSLIIRLGEDCKIEKIIRDAIIRAAQAPKRSSENLGRVAFEKHIEHNFMSYPRLGMRSSTWDELPPNIQAQWQDVADTVIHAEQTAAFGTLTITKIDNEGNVITPTVDTKELDEAINYFTGMLPMEYQSGYRHFDQNWHILFEAAKSYRANMQGN